MSDNETAKNEDRLGREEFRKAFTRVVKSFPGESVIVLDGPWGIGKTHFITDWQKSSGLKCIYFDAFKSDYYPEPFIPLCALLKEQFPAEAAAKDFMEKSKAVGVAILKSALRIGIRAATAGALDAKDVLPQSEVDQAHREIVDASVDSIAAYIEDSINDFTKNQQSFQQFRNMLESLAVSASGDAGPLVFVIDELDRCRPSFAVELLEQIKHLFAVKGVVFVLVLNQEQLASAIKAQYGCTEESSWKYLRKFVNLAISMPYAESTSVFDSKICKFLHELLKEKSDGKFNIHDYSKPLYFLCSSGDIAVRDVQQIASLSIFLHAVRSRFLLDSSTGAIMACLAYLSVVSPYLFAALEGMRGSAEETDPIRAAVMKKLGLIGPAKEDVDEAVRHLITTNFIKFCEGIRQGMHITIEARTYSPRDFLDAVKFLKTY